MYAQLYESGQRYMKALEQHDLLEVQLMEARSRFRKATKTGAKCLAKNLKIRISVLKSMLLIYYQYIVLKNEEVKDLRFKLYREDPGPEDDDENEIYEEL